MNYRDEIAAMLRKMPSDWKAQYESGREKLAKVTGRRLPSVPTPEEAMQLIGITAGGKASGDRAQGPYSPPEDVRRAAMEGLRLSYANNYGAWDFIGIARGIELAISPTVSTTTRQRMANYFTRHNKDRSSSGWENRRSPSRGWMAWLNWGGDPGLRWVSGRGAVWATRPSLVQPSMRSSPDKVKLGLFPSAQSRARLASNPAPIDEISQRNPVDLAGRHIPERYLAGLPAALRQKRIQELTESRDAYSRGDFSELSTDRDARRLGLVKESAYTTVAKERGIEWRGNSLDMARRVLDYYSGAMNTAPRFAEALDRVFAKGLAAWKSGGHRPGATAQNWAVARVNSLVVGGKAAWTADQKEFAVLPENVRHRIQLKLRDVLHALDRQGRTDDVRFLKDKLAPTRANPRPKKLKTMKTGSTLIFDDNGRMLILQRGMTDDWMPGRWCLPGGTMDEGESFLDTAVRETMEETSLSVRPQCLLTQIKDGPWEGAFYIVPFGSWKGVVRLDWENDDYAWVNVTDLNRYHFVPLAREIIELGFQQHRDTT